MMDATGSVFEAPQAGASSSWEIIEPRDPLKSALSHYRQAISDFDGEEETVLREAINPGQPQVPANFLDALSEAREPAYRGNGDHISAVNSDEAGLYRMFLNLSP